MKNLFPGFYKRTDKEISQIWQDGIFVFDTNMLLHIYRYSDEARESFFETLTHLNGRIWIPYQVAYEYQRNRVKVINEQVEAYKKIPDALDSVLRELKKQLEQYKKRHAFIDPVKLTEKITNDIAEAKSQIQQAKKSHPNYKETDPLREKIEELFDGNIGLPYSDVEQENKYQKAEIRFQKQIPPGFEDAWKGSVRQYGDVILWFQILDYACSQKKPIIFITNDEKKDWWSVEEGYKTPLPELVQEMYKEAKVSFHMYEGHKFLKEARSFLNLDANQEIIDEIKEISGEETGKDLSGLSKVRYSAPPRLYAGDVIQRIIRNWLEITYPNHILHEEYWENLSLPRMDFLAVDSIGKRMGIELRYFTRLDYVYDIIKNMLDNMLNIMGKYQEIDEMMVIVATGEINDAHRIVIMLENKVFIPNNVSLVIGHIEPDYQFHCVRVLPR